MKFVTSLQNRSGKSRGFHISLNLPFGTFSKVRDMDLNEVVGGGQISTKCVC